MTHTDFDDPLEWRVNTVGKASPGIELRIVNTQGMELPPGQIGEMIIRGPATGSGYYKNLEKTKESWGEIGINGWYRTGDLAMIDENCNVTINGRLKNVINRGGQIISPEEIEDILYKHHKVRDVCVVPMPDPEMEERACVYIECQPGAQIDLPEIIEFLKQKTVAPFKFPERVEVIEKIPKLVDGQKPDRMALKRDIKDKLNID